MQRRNFVINNRTEKIINEIERRILQGVYPVGCKLPVENEMAREFSVGRSTVREAMKHLSAEGYVSIEQGRGTFVSKAYSKLNDPFGFGKIANETKFQQFLETRLLLEPQIAIAAVKKATDEDLQDLQENVEKYLAQTENTNYAMNLDVEFHKAVAACTHNQVLIQLVPLICETLQQTHEQISDKALGLARAKEVHKQIYQAIKERDPIGARYSMERHIQETIQLTKKITDDLKEEMPDGTGGHIEIEGI